MQFHYAWKLIQSSTLQKLDKLVLYLEATIIFNTGLSLELIKSLIL